MTSARFLLAALLSGLLLIACATDQDSSGADDKLMNSFLGHPQSDLIARWGPPSRTVSDDDGGSILIYEVTEPNSKKVYTAPGSGLRYNIPVTSRSRIFYVNQQGIVSRWSWKGL